MWNGNNNFRHPGEQQQQAAAQQQQQEALRRRLSLELAAAAYSGPNPGLLGAAGFVEDRLALAVAAQEQRQVAVAAAAARQQQQQQLELMALHRHQQVAAQQQAAALAAQELQRRNSEAAQGSAAAAAAVQAVASAVASEFEEPAAAAAAPPKETKVKKSPKKKETKAADPEPKEDAAEETETKPAASPSPTPEEKSEEEAPAKPQSVQPRGKPEAMAKKLASAVRRQEILEEMEAEEQLRQENESKMDSLGTHSSEAKASGTQKKAKPASASKKRKKPDAKSPTAASPAKKKKTPAKKKAPAKKGARKSGEGSKKVAAGLLMFGNSKMPTMDDDVEPITEIEYAKLESLMEQFCRVPLLAEFSRPVALLHPELMNAYNKIVDHPIDLGKVCRRIRRRQYDNLRDVRLDAWRIFANCFKYHSHPSNKDAVPSFNSIALHLRELFNDLWQEHMLPSDFPPPAPSGTGRSKPQDPHAALRAAMEQRVEDRKKRLVVSGLSVMAGNCLVRAADALHALIENGGLVDSLDTKPIWGEGVVMDDDDEGDIEVVLENFRKLESQLREIIANNEELGVDELETNCKKCYTEGDGLENMNATLRIRIASRMDRYLGQLVVPIHEATCRGVSQSSIWGCMAAAVWARESSKKPFWPALVLGIIAPEDQKEEWHRYLTERNEARLPERLKVQLMAGKRRSEQAVKRQSLGQADPQSYFLVEFLGSHEFIWVREADIVENFNPEEDPNKKDAPGSRSKKISRKVLASVLGSKTYANAIEEAQWALEEFELQLQEIGVEGQQDDEESQEEEGYSYRVLSQSDDEADETDEDDPSSESLDQDECNELLATNGLLDFSVAGRKRRAMILKQQKLNAEKKQKTVKAKKARADKAKKAKDEKQKEKEKRQEIRDLEKKRRKRMREREKALKGVQHQKKKRKLSDPAPGRRHQIVSKRERAEAIVGGYVSRAAEKGDYKPLGLSGDQRWIQSALIDSTNLSGMALAFRAAAGLIPMPKQDTGAPGKIVLRPWDKIRVKGKKTSEERKGLLHQQIDLLEKEIKLRKASRLRRLKRLKEVEEELVKMKASILEDDKLARENPLKKSKKPHPLAGKKRKRPAAATADVKADPEKTDTAASNEAEKTEETDAKPEVVPSEETPAEASVKAEVAEDPTDEIKPKVEEAVVN